MRNVDLKLREMSGKVQSTKELVGDSEEDQKRYKQGEYPSLLAAKMSNIKLAERERKLAQQRYDFKREINADPKLGSPYSETDLASEKLRVDRLLLSEQQAVSALTMLKEFDHPKKLRRLANAVASSKLTLERVVLQYDTQKKGLESTLYRKKKHRDFCNKKLAEFIDYRDNCLQLNAETSGKVIWAGTERRKGTPNHKVNDDCPPRKQLMIIPDRNSMQVRTQVYESDIQMVRKIQRKNKIRVNIHLKARPDEKFTGWVDWIDSTNQSGPWTVRGIKFYKVTIKFDGDVGSLGLDPTMSATLRLVLERRENVLQIPGTAIELEEVKSNDTEDDDEKKVRYNVWKIVAGQPVRTEVKIGKSNERNVEILSDSGLSENDIICTSPPENRQTGGNGGQN